MSNENENDMEESESLTEIESEKDKFVCDVCGEVFYNENSLKMHRLRSHRIPAKEGEGVGVQAPKPPEVETIEEAIAFIKERLSQVYGVGKNDRIIVKALEDDPTPLRDGNLLHAFIKSLAPRAYDAHLSTSVIKPLYVRFPNLAQAVDKYLSGTQPQYPFVSQQIYPTQTYAPYYPPPTYAPYYYPSYQTYYSPPAPHYSIKPPKTYKIVVDGQEIETDESGYMAWQRYLKERDEYELRKKQYELEMKKLEAEIKKITEETGKWKEATVPVKIGDKEVEVPAYLAPLYLKSDEEARREIEKLRDELHKKEIEALQKDLEELKKRPGLLDEIRSIQEIAQMLGYQRGGRTTADLLDSLAERIDQRAAQLINKIPAPGGEWKPAVIRTPEERIKKAEEIKQKLERSEEILKCEDELIKAAAKVKPRTEAS
jgi:hypothetical protein